MLSFSEYCFDKLDVFTVDDVIIQIEEVVMDIMERHIVGLDDGDHEGMRKYRITFHYPKSKDKAKYGTYDQEVRYVFAPSEKEARNKVSEFVKGKNKKYLSNIKMKQMGVKSKEVYSWNDLINFMSYLAKKRITNAVKYFDQRDLNILIKKYRQSPDFNALLQTLPKEVQLLLKRVYIHIVSKGVNQDNQRELYSQSKLKTDLSVKDVLDRSTRGLGKKYPKPVLKNVNEEPTVHTFSSVSDILAQAKSYGINYRDLKQLKTDIENEVSPNFNEKVMAWRDIKSKLQQTNYKKQKSGNILYNKSGYVSSKNSMFHGQDATELDKYGGDEWVEELIRNHPFLRSYGNDPYEAIYSFYGQGAPKKPKASYLWYRALETALEYMRSTQPVEPSSKTDIEEIPF